MVDFLIISTKTHKNGNVEIYPKFIVKKSSDLMIRGGDFYAIWLEDQGLWSTDEHDAIQLIDRELTNYAEEYKKKHSSKIVSIKYMWDAESCMIDVWHKYCQRQMRDSFTMLDETLIFSNHETTKSDYASKKLDYPLEKGSIDAYDSLMSVLYSKEERHKIEWAIGAIVTGDSKHIQKFMVLYGSAGTGKSTVLNIIQQLFEGYYSVFDAKALGSSSNSFALEAFRSNPLVAIQHDGDLSRIEDNTRLNSLVSHEVMTVNEKFKSTYSSSFKSFLIMGTNKPVKITDAKSGLIRRLIDVSPTGNTLKINEYKLAINQIRFELGAIAHHCKEVYLDSKEYYDDYIPTRMLGASNDFYNFIIDSYYIFKEEDGVSLKSVWAMYKEYCNDANVLYPQTQRIFKEELKNYFHEHYDRYTTENGDRVRNYYKGFIYEKFDKPLRNDELEIPLIQFDGVESIFDSRYSEYPAQYANEKETPTYKWDDVTTKVKDLDTTELHYVLVPENHVVIDFDIRGEDGKKSYERNLKEASKWPKTYSELSKSGEGIHLHYIYDGDVSRLSRVYSDDIEIKVFVGKSSLRRRLTQCNSEPILTINSGLPLKGDRKMASSQQISNEKGLRTLLKKILNKEVHEYTKPSVDFIYKILDDAYDDGLHYDVTDMRNAILAFAANSSNQSVYCIKLVNKMKFKSEEASEAQINKNKPVIFFDLEVYPNLLHISWKKRGEGNPIVRMINPEPAEIEDLLDFNLVGFNNRRYDNHIMYARLMGYSNEQLYNLSQKIIGNNRNALFGEAYNLSYTDVYDFSTKKQSLKKWEIELGLEHKEMEIPWDQPVPEDQWDSVGDYCDVDVLATEAVFEANQDDFTARQILADLAGMSVNDTTNTLTTRIIFGSNRNPQSHFNYRDLGEVSENHDRFLTDDWYTCSEEYAQGKGFPQDGYNKGLGDEYTRFNKQGQPVFPGYKYEGGISTYRGEEVGEGGYVYSEPGMHVNVAVLDIASMHPSSIISEELFGTEYTKRFKDLVETRLYIKHGEFGKAKKSLGGKLAKHLVDNDASSAEKLSTALKIAINSVYGLTAARFDNAFRDIRNIDNIVAKRGALFMINLKNEVQQRGYQVAHIKTDSIKIPNADPEIISFITRYGEQYGYVFEHEDTYKKMTLVNDAVFIAKTEKDEWEAVGLQFQIPYVYKKLFTKEPIVLEDMREIKSVTTSLYLDMNEDLKSSSDYEKEYKKLMKEESTEEIVRRRNELVELINDCHNYIFIGKVGSFTPVKKGAGGGTLMRAKMDKNNNKIGYTSVSGTKGYRWLPFEVVKGMDNRHEVIDKSYYNKLVDEAHETISKYGDFEWFVS